MSLQGTLLTMPLGDLLGWLEASRKTGALTLQAGEHTTTLFIDVGRVISCSSSDPQSYFGQFLLVHTKLTEEELRRAFERQEKTRVYVGRNIYIKTLLGKILLDEGVLTEEEITRVLRLKTEETVLNAFLWEEGSFRFNPSELPPDELVPLSIDLRTLVKRGVQRQQGWKEIRSAIPSNEAVFRVLARPAAPAPGDPLAEFAERVLALLGEGRSLKDVILSLHATEYAVNRQAYHLLEAGAIALVAPPPPRMRAREAGDADQLKERGRALFDALSFADTVVAARQALRTDPANDQARALLDRSEKELTGSFYARLFAPDDVFHRCPDVSAPAELSPEERFILERVNGRWDVRSIVKLTPLKEVDALAVFKKLLDLGLIRLARG